VTYPTLPRRQIKELEESVRDEVEDAVKFADESPKPVRPRRRACAPVRGSAATPADAQRARDAVACRCASLAGKVSGAAQKGDTAMHSPSQRGCARCWLSSIVQSHHR
jgi:hypothetical protein